MVWQPITCCGCASPRTGTLVLGWIALILGALHLLSSLKYAPYGYSDWEELCEMVIEKNDVKYIDADTCANTIMAYIISAVVASCIVVTISILLLVGVNKTKPLMMLPFMICQVIRITLSGIVGLFFMVIISLAGYTGIGFFVSTISVLIVFLEVYFFLVVRVCYKEVKQHAMGMGTECNRAKRRETHLFHEWSPAEME